MTRPRVNQSIAKCPGPCDIAIPIVYPNQPITIPVAAVREQIPFEGIDVEASMRATFTDPDSSPPLSIQSVRAQGPAVIGLGHAGIAIINGVSGAVAYFEYGRYDGARGFGRVREVALSPSTITFDDSNKPDSASFASLLRSLAQTNNPTAGYDFEAVYIELPNGAFDIMKAFAEQRRQQIEEGPEGGAQPYNVANNHCFTFAMEVISEVGVGFNIRQANPLNLKLQGGNFLTRGAVSTFAPTFEVPARQMRALQTQYPALNVSNEGRITNGFQFP
ncbi:hypothetical protein ADINL_0548 [Nitrincola lacisaponensis]|uniref:Type VI secretion system effector TseH-like domain-containing protein n=1 Tax=Nitrincola lacisaponensis TaxID=267850 RepID=A0A063Y5E1_9GAMM|nr:hypothetical protein [Nitrincola lacisaponensis]KDE40899.1 hypothetical protein ADINL_0548 [Nitrincola lacisaponensis]